MSALLKRLFNIRQDEMLVFTAFFLFYFIIGIQFSIGLTVSEALFLSEVGPGFLPYMYVFNAFMIIAVSGVYSSFTEKLSVSSMFKAVLLFFIGLILGIRLLIAVDLRAFAMPIAYPLLHTLFVMFTNMLPNNFRAFYGLYLDVLQSKRLVPIILTGGRYGGIVGGLSIPLLIPVLGSVANLLFIWIGAILLSIGFVQYIEMRLRDELLEEAAGPRKRGGGKGGKSREGNLALLRTNKYIAAFALFSFLVVILRSFQDFQYSVIFREVFPRRAELAAFLGYFTAIGSGVSLLIQTFITPRIIRRLGLGTANLIYPLTTLLGLAGMLVSPSFYSAVFLRFNNKNLQESVRNAINALLYNAVSPSVRGRVGAFVAGQVVAVASILSGIILLIIKPTGLALFPLSPRWLAFISLLIGGLYLAAGFAMRREYGAALRKMLEERNLGLFRYAQEGFGPMDQESLAILTRNLREGDDDLCLFAAGMLSNTGEPEALSAIMEEIPRRRGRAVCELLRLLARAPGAKDNEQVRKIWSDSLASDDPGCRVAAMEAIARVGLVDEVVDQIQECLDHESPEVRAQAVRLLVRSDDLFCLASGLQTLHAMLEQGRIDERICALRCIGELENPRFIRRLLPYLYQPETEVREAALGAVERLLSDGDLEDERVDEVMRVSLSDTSPSMRRRGVRLLGRRGKRIDFERMLAALSDPEENVRREAVSSLKMMKRKGTLSLEGGGLLSSFLGPLLYGALNGSIRQEMTASDIVEGLNDYSLDHLREVYEIINHLGAIEQKSGSEKFVMLRKTLWDRVQERQSLLLELLGVIGDEKTVDTVSESLARGGSSSRAIAIETLSNVNAVGPTRQIILMLEPLLLGGSAAEKLSEGRKFFDLPPVTLGQVLRTYADSNDPWIRAVAIDAAGHFLAEEAAGQTPESREAWTVQLKALTYDEDPYVRESAVCALGRIGDKEDGVQVFLKSNENDADERVRIQARRALKRIELAQNGKGRPQPEGADEKMLSTIEKALFLKGIKMFETMTADQLKILSNISKDIQVSGGKILFEEGDPCDYLYVIVDGEIEIFKDSGVGGDEVLAILGPSASFGEIALFGDEGRSAGARAKKDTSLLGIEKEPLLLLIHEHPAISIAIIAQLAYIIRNQNEAAVAVSREEE